MNQRTFFNDDMTPKRSPAPTRVPFAVGSETSKAAAKALSPRAATSRERVLRFIQGRGNYGATDAEGQTALGMPSHSYVPRRVDLEKAGEVYDSGHRRKTPSGRLAAVWVTKDNRAG